MHLLFTVTKIFQRFEHIWETDIICSYFVTYVYLILTHSFHWLFIVSNGHDLQSNLFYSLMEKVGDWLLFILKARERLKVRQREKVKRVCFAAVFSQVCKKLWIILLHLYFKLVRSHTETPFSGDP